MAHPDLNRLLNSLLPFAQRMLAEHREFYPFGSSMKSNGEIVSVGADNGSEHPPSQNLIDLMAQTFEQQARVGAIRAAGICYDVLTIPPGQTRKIDAVCASLEHESGEAVDVFMPYEKMANGSIRYLESFATPRLPHFFMPKRVV
jgi:hypothetical protein